MPWQRNARRSPFLARGMAQSGLVPWPARHRGQVHLEARQAEVPSQAITTWNQSTATWAMLDSSQTNHWSQQNRNSPPTALVSDGRLAPASCLHEGRNRVS